jgi:hypothetical protein
MEFLLVEGALVTLPCDASDYMGHAESSVSTCSASGSKSEQSIMADAVPRGMLRQCREKSCEDSYLGYLTEKGISPTALYDSVLDIRSYGNFESISAL